MILQVIQVHTAVKHPVSDKWLSPPNEHIYRRGETKPIVIWWYGIQVPFLWYRNVGKISITYHFWISMHQVSDVGLVTKMPWIIISISKHSKYSGFAALMWFLIKYKHIDTSMSISPPRHNILLGCIINKDSTREYKTSIYYVIT